MPPRMTTEVHADQLLHHEVDELVEEVEELGNQRTKLVKELVIKMVNEVTEVTERMEALTKSLTSPRSSLSNCKNLLPTIIAQVGSQASNIQGDVRNVSVNNGRGRCSYKEFLACNPKDYDGKGDAIAYTHWTEKMESVQDMSGCGDNQKVQTRGWEAVVGITWEDFKALMSEEFCPNNEMQKLETKFWCHVMVGAGHAAYTNRFHKLARLAPHLVTPENKGLKARMLTDDAIRNGSLKKNTEKRGNGTSRDGNVRDDNKRSRTGRAFALTTNPVRKEYT
ncbi:reverse transcriptase domain-containing protein, partial [Tanacetum coccineum]